MWTRGGETEEYGSNADFPLIPASPPVPTSSFPISPTMNPGMRQDRQLFGQDVDGSFSVGSPRSQGQSQGQGSGTQSQPEPFSPTAAEEMNREQSEDAAASEEQETYNQNPGRYKTELCHSWVETQTCRYGHKCQFAHGENELRRVDRHPKFKSEKCFAPETMILMGNGTLAEVQSLKIGDVLVGDDTMPRFVKDVWTGEARLYTVELRDEDMASSDNYIYKCTSGHTLAVTIPKELVSRRDKVVSFPVLHYVGSDLDLVVPALYSVHCTSNEEADALEKERMKCDLLWEVSIEDYMRWYETQNAPSCSCSSSCADIDVNLDMKDHCFINRVGVFEYPDTDTATAHELDLVKAVSANAATTADKDSVQFEFGWMVGLWLRGGFTIATVATTAVDDADEHKYKYKLVCGSSNSKAKGTGKAMKKRITRILNNRNTTLSKLNEMLQSLPINTDSAMCSLFGSQSIVFRRGFVQGVCLIAQPSTSAGEGESESVVGIVDADKTLVSTTKHVLRSLGVRFTQDKKMKTKMKMNIYANSTHTRSLHRFQIHDSDTAKQKQAFVGLSVSGNGLFLLSDFSITHNCKAFHQVGQCPYGSRCRFIHTKKRAVPAQIEALQSSNIFTMSMYTEEEGSSANGSGGGGSGSAAQVQSPVSPASVGPGSSTMSPVALITDEKKRLPVFSKLIDE